jgi:hypothetical protein
VVSRPRVELTSVSFFNLDDFVRIKSTQRSALKLLDESLS